MLHPFLRLFLLSFFLLFQTISATVADDTASVEAEAMEIADRLRCMVCSDPNIETASDETAKDLRFFIRRHLTDGKSQDLVVNLVLSNYGEMVSLEIPATPSSDNELFFSRIVTGLFFALMLFYIYRRSRRYDPSGDLS